MNRLDIFFLHVMWETLYFLRGCEWYIAQADLYLSEIDEWVLGGEDLICDEETVNLRASSERMADSCICRTRKK